MKPSLEMLQTPAYLALGGSARNVLRVLLEEVDNPAATVRLETNFFADAGVTGTALNTGTRDLTALGFIAVAGDGRSVRKFTLIGGWRAIADRAEAEGRVAEARPKAAAKQPMRRPRAAPKAPAADASADRPLPQGVRRARWPQLPWLQGDAS